MTDDIYIRQWSGSDWQIFRAIRLEALSMKPNVFGASFQTESEKDDSFWKERLTKNGAVFGLYDKGTVIGLTGVYRDYNRPTEAAILCMSYIRPEYRGRNLSDLLYKARIDWAKAQDGIRIITVGHREGNEASRRANQRWGFTLAGVDNNHPFGDGKTDKYYSYELKI